MLLRNDGGNRNRWIGIQLIGRKSNRDGIGAKVSIRAGNVQRWKQSLGGTSYCTASDRRLLFGLGTYETVAQIEVTWPSGQVSVLKNVKSNQYLTLTEGAEMRK